MTVVERDHWFLYCHGIVEYCDGSLCIKVDFTKQSCFGCNCTSMSISKSYYVDHNNKLSKGQNVVVLCRFGIDRDKNGALIAVQEYAVYDERSSEWKEIIEQEESANLNKKNMTKK